MNSAYRYKQLVNELKRKLNAEEITLEQYENRLNTINTQYDEYINNCIDNNIMKGHGYE
jgi:hypothetical protein